MGEQLPLKPDAVEAVPAAHQSDPMIAMIERVVMDPSADLDKLERILAMKERMDAESARRAFSDAMAACQSEMEPVARNKDNEQTKSRYSDLAAIYKACKPIAAKHGFSFSTFPAPCDKASHMGVRWIVRHHRGHEESDVADVPLDDKGPKGTTNKTQTHAFGSTASYARRYIFCMIFDVATKDDDDGTSAGGTITAEQFQELREKIDATGADEARFLRYLEVENLEELPMRDFGKATAALNQKAARNA